MLERNKKPLYYCRRLTPADTDYVDGMETFFPAVLRYLNYKSLSGEMMLETIGEVNSKNLIAKMPLGGDTYTEGDRCYINVEPPETADPLCADADYRVISASRGSRTAEIVFERMAAGNANISS